MPDFMKEALNSEAFRLNWTANIAAWKALSYIGTGNIVGVATAIASAGPGAVFWMWAIALVGMFIKYNEALRARQYTIEERTTEQYTKKEKTTEKRGPMYYIEKGLGDNWKWLATIYAVMGAIGAFSIGNMVQSNSIADALDDHGVAPLATAAVIFLLLLATMLSGAINDIVNRVMGIWFPLMTILYMTSCLVILIANYCEILDVFYEIVTNAFTVTAVAGGLAGATIASSVRFGVARGVFSSEIGLGSSAISHIEKTEEDDEKDEKNLGRKLGRKMMLITFLDTVIVCSMTAFVIIIADVWDSGETGVDLTAMAFDQELGIILASLTDGLTNGLMIGHYIVILSLIVFAFMTIEAWCYYGEKYCQYLFGFGGVAIYRLAWVAAVFIGPWALGWRETTRESIDLVWFISDILIAAMALPNLLGLSLLPFLGKPSTEKSGKKK